MRALVSTGYDNKENRIRNFLFLTLPTPGLVSQEPTKQRMWTDPNGSILMEVMGKKILLAHSFTWLPMRYENYAILKKSAFGSSKPTKIIRITDMCI